MAQCKNKTDEAGDTGVVWILASNADTKPSWNMDVLGEISDFKTYRVQALIMISDLYPRLNDQQEGTKFAVP